MGDVLESFKHFDQILNDFSFLDDLLSQIIICFNLAILDIFDQLKATFINVLTERIGDDAKFLFFGFVQLKYQLEVFSTVSSKQIKQPCVLLHQALHRLD